VRIRSLAALALAAAALPLLGACSALDNSSKTAATSTPSAVPKPSAASTYAPLAGPVEPAKDLPQQCSQILSTAQLQTVFGAGFPIGVNYGSYAPLPSIGRTGRVACVFGVGLDSFGAQSAGSLEVSISTYTGAADAVGRAADTVQSDSQAGATEAAVSVGGHPATIVVEQPVHTSTPVAPATPVPGSPSAAGTGASATPSAAPSVTPSATSSAAANGGETELVMADGNRTFVFQAPLAKLSAQQAVTALTQLALEAYQNTLPPAPTASAKPSPAKT
jgi:hypothetical protein